MDVRAYKHDDLGLIIDQQLEELVEVGLYPELLKRIKVVCTRPDVGLNDKLLVRVTLKLSFDPSYHSACYLLLIVIFVKWIHAVEADNSDLATWDLIGVIPACTKGRKLCCSE